MTANELKEARLRLGLTQTQMAEAAHREAQAMTLYNPEYKYLPLSLTNTLRSLLYGALIGLAFSAVYVLPALYLN